MTDDDMTRRVAETLRVEASTVKSPPDAWEHFTARNVTPVATPSWRRPWLLVPVGVVAAAAALAIVLTTTSSVHHSTQISSVGGPTLPVPTPTAPPSVASPPVPVGPKGGPVPRGFVPASVTFVSASNGWVLGTAACASPPCTSVVRTTDGGRTWAGIPAPRTALNAPAGPATAGVSTLRFANRLDGWAFGPELWTTHDGGASWHRVTLGNVADLAAADGRVHAAIIENNGKVGLASSPVATDDFVVGLSVDVGAGPVPSSQLLLRGSSGWFVQVDRVVVAGARLVHGAWVPWSPPCLGGGGPLVLAASSATELVGACDVGVWTAASAAERLFVSHDAGTTFVDSVAIPAQTVAGIASPAPAHVLVAGETPPGLVLLSSTDAGHTWTTALHLTGGRAWVDVGFTTATQGVAIVEGPTQLLMTHDAGRTWAPVTFG